MHVVCFMKYQALCHSWPGRTLQQGNVEPHSHQIAQPTVVAQGFSDSDWVSAKDRHSVTGGVVVVDGNVVAHWSRKQKSTSTSSCEAEYLAMLSCGQECMFVRAICDFLTGLNSKLVCIVILQVPGSMQTSQGLDA